MLIYFYMTAIFEAERKKLTFSVEDMSIYLYGSREIRDLYQYFYQAISTDPILKFDPIEYSMSRAEMVTLYLRKAFRLHELFSLTTNHNILFKAAYAGHLSLGIHAYMFIPTIKNLGTPKQVENWLPRAEKCEVIGCYAQTEMGHGSDVQHLQTTAVYDFSTDEIILNSPTIESIKWWPGELGLVANHAITHAQLIVKDKNYGIQTFIIQLRDIDTHKVLPGIKLGDIGPKLGYNSKDNGFLKFTNARIPRENMLMKYSKLNKKGEFFKPSNEKIAYATMMSIRSLLLNECSQYLSMAHTIAVRYSIFRTQFYDENQKERKILDYQLQMDKILPYIAYNYGINAAIKKIDSMYNENLRRINENEDFSLMGDLHATLAGTKAFYTADTGIALELARMSCGGHGFSQYSGLPNLYLEFSATCTLEGENTVMALQTARYLLKCLETLRRGKDVQESAEYLKFLNEILAVKQWSGKSEDDIDLTTIHEMVRVNAAYAVYDASQKLIEGASSGLSLKESWDKKAGIALVEAARAHITCFTVKAFIEYIPFAKEFASQKILDKLCQLYGLHKLLQHPFGLLESGYIQFYQIKLIKNKKEILLEELRPEALGLVEAWGLPDNSLKSAIGKSDGKVYETLLDWAQNKNPLNEREVHESFEKYIKPLKYIKPGVSKFPRPGL